MSIIDKATITEPGKIPSAELLEEIDYMDELELVWNKRWGAQSEIGKLRMCMVSKPTENDVYEESQKDPLHFLFLEGVPKLERLKKQHDDFVNVLKAEGVEVVVLKSSSSLHRALRATRENMGTGLSLRHQWWSDHSKIRLCSLEKGTGGQSC